MSSGYSWVFWPNVHDKSSVAGDVSVVNGVNGLNMKGIQQKLRSANQR